MYRALAPWNYAAACAAALLWSMGAVAAERNLANFQGLSASVPADFTCEPQVTVTVRAPDAAAFTGERMKLQKLVGGLRAALGFECADTAITDMLIVGEAGGQEVYRGAASANGNWLLTDLGVPNYSSPPDTSDQQPEALVGSTENRPSEKEHTSETVHAISPRISGDSRVAPGVAELPAQEAENIQQEAKQQHIQSAPSKVITLDQLETFIKEKESEYRVIVTTDDELGRKKLVRNPEVYKGKVVAFVAIFNGRKTAIEFYNRGSLLYFASDWLEFHMSGVDRKSETLKLGPDSIDIGSYWDRFFLIGSWEQDRKTVSWGIRPYLICGMLVAKTARKAEILCETLKESSTLETEVYKKVRSIKEVDFLNFTFHLSEDCGQKIATIKNGEFQDDKIRIKVNSEILYTTLDNYADAAVMSVYCNFYGNYFVTEILLYTLRNGEPTLFARLPQSIIDRDYKIYYPEGFDFEIMSVAANNGKLIINKAVDGSHACPENGARFEYIWNGKSFALAGKPIKYLLRNCGTQEEKVTTAPPTPEPVPTPTPPEQPSATYDLTPVVLKGVQCGVGLIPGSSLIGQFEIVQFIKVADNTSGVLAVAKDLYSGKNIRAPFQALRIIQHEVCVEAIVELLAPGQLGALEQCLAASTPEERACLQNILEQIGFGSSVSVVTPPGVTPPTPKPTPPKG